jgi:hypothetical protein
MVFALVALQPILKVKYRMSDVLGRLLLAPRLALRIAAGGEGRLDDPVDGADGRGNRSTVATGMLLVLFCLAIQITPSTWTKLCQDTCAQQSKCDRRG